MAKATIISHLGAGLYRVKLLFDNVTIAQKITSITTQITALDAKITDLEAQKNAAYADLQTALNAINAYIASVTAEQIASNPSDLNALTKTAFTARAEYDSIALNWRAEKVKRTAMQTNRDYLQNNCPSDITMDAWSARYDVSLTGDVATSEVDCVLQRDSGKSLSVVNDSGVWLLPGVAVDSRLQHPLARSEHATWYDLCVLPAVQRDKARFRVATVSGIDKILNTCTVTFDGTTSIDDNRLVPSKPITPKNGASGPATFDYPPCNSAVFENGDRVIVKNGTTVIGFYSNPRQCPTSFVISFNPFNTQIDTLGGYESHYSVYVYDGSGAPPEPDGYTAYNSYYSESIVEDGITATKNFPIKHDSVQVGNLSTVADLTYDLSKSGVYQLYSDGVQVLSVCSIGITSTASVIFTITLDGVFNVSKTLQASKAITGSWSGITLSSTNPSFGGTSETESMDKIIYNGTNLLFYKTKVTTTISGGGSFNASDRTVRSIDVHTSSGVFVENIVYSDSTTPSSYSNSFSTPLLLQNPPTPTSGSIPFTNMGIIHKPITSGGIINI